MKYVNKTVAKHVGTPKYLKNRNNDIYAGRFIYFKISFM